MWTTGVQGFQSSWEVVAVPTGVAAGERPSPRGTHPAGPPLTVTAAGKGLRGSRPHAAPPRMRARAALSLPGVSARGRGLLRARPCAVYPEGTCEAAGHRVLPNRDRCPTFPGSQDLSQNEFCPRGHRQDISGGPVPPRGDLVHLPPPPRAGGGPADWDCGRCSSRGSATRPGLRSAPALTVSEVGGSRM